MDGMSQPRARIPGPVLGILYAEDFDDPLPEAPPPTPEPDPEPPAPAPTQVDIDRTCADAVRRARLAWDAEQAERRGAALAAIAGAIHDARNAAEREAHALAEGTVATMLAMLSGVLPRLCERHGPGEARALVQLLLPTVRNEPRISIRAHPALVPALEDDLAQLDTELAGAVTIAGAQMASGDLRVSWERGSFRRDSGKILAAIQDALAQLGLLEPIDFTPERRMALAE
jgi:hypothetical protein